VLLSKTDIDCVFITEYSNRVRENTCNVYIKLHNSKKIPIAIRIDNSFKIEVEAALVAFLGIKKIEQRKYLMNI
jgi:hypothetical protein